MYSLSSTHKTWCYRSLLSFDSLGWSSILEPQLSLHTSLEPQANTKNKKRNLKRSEIKKTQKRMLIWRIEKQIWFSCCDLLHKFATFVWDRRLHQIIYLSLIRAWVQSFICSVQRFLFFILLLGIIRSKAEYDAPAISIKCGNLPLKTSEAAGMYNPGQYMFNHPLMKWQGTHPVYEPGSLEVEILRSDL